MDLANRRALAHATHELRGSLAVVELCVAAVEQRGCRGEDLAGLVETVRAQIQRGTLAIEDVEALQQRRVLRASREPVDVGLLVARRERAWQRLAELSGARMDVVWRAPGALVIGDARRLCQALDNLVSNAIRHGGKRIVVRAEQSGSVLRVELHDGGQGLPRAAVTPSPVPLDSKHGHGLAIARLAVESSCGTIEPIDGGVVIELPVQASRPIGQAASVGEPSVA